MQSVTLNNSVEMPQIGLGTFALKEQAIVSALQTGYRMLDTAWQYGNEEEVGNAVRHSGIERKDIFITTKLWTDHIRQHAVREAFEDSLRKLQTDYVDLYLIHWPAEGFETAWKVMEELYAEGRVRAIGVSNCHIQHLELLEKVSDVVPAVNQVESHPLFSNEALIQYSRDRGIVPEAWCPLGGSGCYKRVLENPLIAEMARRYNRTEAQIVLRWHIQRGIVIIPRSSDGERQKKNIDVTDFELTAEDMAVIAGIDTGRRIGANPDTFNF